ETVAIDTPAMAAISLMFGIIRPFAWQCVPAFLPIADRRARACPRKCTGPAPADIRFQAGGHRKNDRSRNSQFAVSAGRQPRFPDSLMR
ncbi:MAG TPA: hypothetical protein VN222_02085, partial [Novosphingobium sp.]|nr:hypothetical protein [Novosphingobium sp.]